MSPRLVILAVVVFLCSSSASAGVAYTFAPGVSVFTSPLSSSDLCYQIGFSSGCSGCQASKGNNCNYYLVESQSRPNQFQAYCYSEDEVPRPRLKVFDASSTCPSDPTKEPIYRIPNGGRFVDADGIALGQGVSSTWHSSWHEDDLANFPAAPWAVDRSTFYGVAGYSKFSYFDGPLDVGLTCASLTEPSLFNVNDFLEGSVVTERDRFCAEKFLGLALSAFCPQYGVPVSGICSSLMDEIENNCGYCKTNVRLRRVKNGGSTYVLPFLDAYAVVPDETSFCLKEIPIMPSHHMLTLAGLNAPDATPVFRPYTSYTPLPVCPNLQS